MIKRFIGLHAEYPLFLPDFKELEFSRQTLKKYSNITLHENQSSRSLVFPCGWTDMTKLAVTFHNYANTPKKV
jgi:hypothetical protein